MSCQDFVTPRSLCVQHSTYLAVFVFLCVFLFVFVAAQHQCLAKTLSHRVPFVFNILPTWLCLCFFVCFCLCLWLLNINVLPRLCHTAFPLCSTFYLPGCVCVSLCVFVCVCGCSTSMSCQDFVTPRSLCVQHSTYLA